MFNMKTSDLFKRAKQLADLEGSDFITWNEAINCINESNVGLYEKLINMGDNSFVKDFHITDKEMELPSDFWQLKGVYLWNNGNRQVINRRADADGIHHLCYELRNGKIYLFGNPNDVYVEYFPKPKKLYFKPDEVRIDLDSTKDYIACFGHTFLYKDYDSSNNKTLSLYDFDGYKTKRNFIQFDWTQGMMDTPIMGEDYILLSGSSGRKIYNMAKGTTTTISAPSWTPFLTESGKLYMKYPHLGNQIVTPEGIVVGTTDYNFQYSYPVYCNDELTDFYQQDAYGHILHNTQNTEISITSNIKGLYSKGNFFYADAVNIIAINDKEVLFKFNYSGTFIGFVGINDNTGYGYAIKKYNQYFVCPYVEDTPLEYPNSTYFQIIAYILAIMFKSKQGADISLLSSQLQMAEQTFEDTLGSDAFQFTRMGNVYN